MTAVTMWGKLCVHSASVSVHTHIKGGLWFAISLFFHTKWTNRMPPSSVTNMSTWMDDKHLWRSEWIDVFERCVLHIRAVRNICKNYYWKTILIVRQYEQCYRHSPKDGSLVGSVVRAILQIYFLFFNSALCCASWFVADHYQSTLSRVSCPVQNEFSLSNLHKSSSSSAVCL